MKITKEYLKQLIIEELTSEMMTQYSSGDSRKTSTDGFVGSSAGIDASASMQDVKIEIGKLFAKKGIWDSGPKTDLQGIAWDAITTIKPTSIKQLRAALAELKAE